MNKKERFFALVRGQEADRRPVGAWIHYGSAHMDPTAVADLHLQFHHEYDWDFIKVMHDYRYQLPAAVGAGQTIDEISRIAHEAVVRSSFERQLKVLQAIQRQRTDDAPIVETLFTPVQTLVRSLGRPVIELLRQNPEVAHDVLSVIADELRKYIAEIREIGVEGLFLSINGAAEDAGNWAVSTDEYLDWIAPYDKRLLDAALGLVTIAHVHGYKVNLDRLDGYKFDVMSWSHIYSDFGLDTAVERFGATPLGGLDEVASLYYSPQEVFAEIGHYSAERQRLIVGPGCTLHSDTPPNVLKALRASVNATGK